MDRKKSCSVAQGWGVIDPSLVRVAKGMGEEPDITDQKGEGGKGCQVRVASMYDNILIFLLSVLFQK